MSNNLHRNLMVVSFRACGVGTNIKDEEMERELIERHGLSEKRVRTTKKILGSATLPIMSEVNKLRRFLQGRTFAGIGDQRLIVAGELDSINKKVNESIAVCRQAVIDLQSDWDDVIEQERTELGDRFDLADYPSPDALPSLFKFEWTVQPMPEPSSFQLITALTEHQAEAYRQQYEAQVSAASANIEARSFQRTLDLIKDVATTLADPNKPLIDGEGRQGCIPKLREQLERIPALNFTNNPQLAQLHAEVSESLTLATSSLRNSKTMRSRAANTASNIHERFAKFDRRLAV